MTYSKKAPYSRRTADPEEVAELLFTELFSAVVEDHNAYICITANNPTAATWSDSFFTSISAASRRAIEISDGGMNSYFALATRIRRRRKGGIGHIVTLHVDAEYDSPDDVQHLWSAQPSIVVASGSPYSFHAYWLLSAPDTDYQLALELNRRLNRLVRARKLAATDPARLLRAPCTFNYKHPDPQQVEIVHFDCNRRSTLKEYAAWLNIDRTDHSGLKSETLTPSVEEKLLGSLPTGRFVSAEELPTAMRLDKDGLGEEGTRNDAILLLTRYYYSVGYTSHGALAQKLKTWLAQKNNGLSQDWKDRPDWCEKNIEQVVSNWLGKVRLNPETKLVNKKLGHCDEEWVLALNVSQEEREFIYDLLEFILNYARGDNLILSVNQLCEFRHANRQNYKARLALACKLEIIRFRLRHKNYRDGLADEYQVLYRWQGATLVRDRRGRKRKLQKKETELVDRLIARGISTKEIQRQFTSWSRQRIANRRRRHRLRAKSAPAPG